MQRLFVDADINKDGTLELSELQLILKKASGEFSHLEEHATFLEGYTPQARISCNDPTAPLPITAIARLIRFQEEFADKPKELKNQFAHLQKDIG